MLSRTIHWSSTMLVWGLYPWWKNSSLYLRKSEEQKKLLWIHSYSKTAGFTGVRCGYTICTERCRGQTTLDGKQRISLNQLSGIADEALNLMEQVISANAQLKPSILLKARNRLKATINYYMTKCQNNAWEPYKTGIQSIWGRKCTSVGKS